MNSDSSLESVEELDLGTRKSSVQPYVYEPMGYATPSCSSDSEEDSDSEQQMESDEENPTDPSEWCTCGSCGPMPTQRECKCCHNTNIVDGKVKIENLKCITEHEGFLGNCLNIHVLEASYYEFIQSEGLQHEPVHDMYLLVEFTDNVELAIIPDNWLEGNSCGLWPAYRSSSRATKAAINKEPPTGSWKAYPIRVLYKHESYEKVRSKLKRAEFDSDLMTDADEVQNTGRPVRRKRSPRRYSSSDNDQLKTRKRPTLHAVEVQSPTEMALPKPPAPQRSLGEATPSTPSSNGRHLPTTRPWESATTTPSTPSSSGRPSATETLSTPSSSGRPFMPTTRPSKSATETTSTPSSSGRQLVSPNRQAGTIIARDVRLFTVLEKMREEQLHQTALLTNILGKLGLQSEGSDGLPDDIIFPMTTVDDMKAFDLKMADKYTQKVVVSHIASIGGCSIENMGMRVLKYMVSNQLADQYNWTGVNKPAFRSLSIPLIVKRAVERSFRLVTVADIESCCKSFLKCAKDRDGGRLKRMKRKEQLPVASTVVSEDANSSSSDD